jgi:hypothetical protein
MIRQIIGRRCTNHKWATLRFICYPFTKAILPCSIPAGKATFALVCSPVGIGGKTGIQKNPINRLWNGSTRVGRGGSEKESRSVAPRAPFGEFITDIYQGSRHYALANKASTYLLNLKGAK